MDVKKCDRCGKYYEKNESGKYDGGKILMFEHSDFFSREDAKIHGDLCEECAKEFERWLKNESA